MFLEREPEFRKSRSSEFQPVVADGKKDFKILQFTRKLCKFFPRWAINQLNNACGAIFLAIS